MPPGPPLRDAGMKSTPTPTAALRAAARAVRALQGSTASALRWCLPTGMQESWHAPHHPAHTQRVVYLVSAVLCSVVMLPTVSEFTHHYAAVHDVDSPHWGGSGAAFRRAMEDRESRLLVAHHRQEFDGESRIRLGPRRRTSAEPPCRTNSDIFPGVVHAPEGNLTDLRWEPRRDCRVQHFAQPAVRRCLEALNQTFVFIGDSLVEGMVQALGRAAGMRTARHAGETRSTWPTRNNTVLRYPEGGGPLMKFFWTQSAMLMDPTNGTDRHNASASIAMADKVFIHHAVWDMGLSCQGIFPFYRAMKHRLLELRRHMKEGAELAAIDLKWLQPAQCGIHLGIRLQCVRWNRLERIAAFREALRLAAACTNTSMYSSIAVTKEMGSHSRDGLHFENPAVFGMESDIFYNTVCPRGEAPPMLLTEQPVVCDERGFFRRWSSLPRAVYCPKETELA